MQTRPLFDEQLLMDRIAGGDQQAFRVVYDTFSNKIYAFAVGILKSTVMAEEVVQECMLRLWKRGEELTQVQNLESYLQTMARNLAIDMLRREQLALRAGKENAAAWQELHDETQEHILLNDTRKVLAEGIALLPAQQRLVYELCHQQGLKYEQAAKQLGLSVHTVQFYMKLALRFLRNYISTHTDLGILCIIFKLL